MMQFHAPRRSGKTYGKTNRNVLVHDLFEYRDARDSTASPASTTGPSAFTSEGDIEHERDSGSAKIYDTSRRDAPNSPFAPNASKRDMSAELNRSLIQDASLFEIETSEEDASTDTSGSRASKRRRIMKPLGARKLHLSEEIPSVIPSLGEQESAVAEKRLKHAKTLAPAHVLSASDTNKSLKLSKVAPHDSQVRSKSTSTQRPKAKPTQMTAKSNGKTSIKKYGHKESTPPAEQFEPQILGYSSDASQHATNLVRTTPRIRKASPIGADAGLPSPSQLRLTSLKLGTNTQSPARHSPDLSSDGGSAPRRGRQRLIDRLDPPVKRADYTFGEVVPEVQSGSTTNKPAKSSRSRNRTTGKVSHNEQLQQSRVVAEEDQDPRGRLGLTKPRTTYATQRSHLSDMVDDLDGIGPSSSQKSLDDLLTRIPASNLASQLDLEDEDSDDQVAASKLKSIHELRQAGANNRFDRELDALLEDIDTGGNASKSLRLQALIKLVNRLNDSNFVRHLAINSRIQRLLQVAHPSLDLPSGVMLTKAFCLLATSENTSLSTLAQLFKATALLAPNMLIDSRSISKIAKDRKQNLSKVMIQDLTDFEMSNEYQSGSPISRDSCSPDTTAVNCLERTLRKLVQLGDASVRISTSVYVEILHLAQAQVDSLDSNGDETATLTKLERTLSLLELCSVIIDDADLHISDNDYISLGDALARGIFKRRESQESLERSVLRVVVSLSNNKPRMCELLGHTGIHRAAFSIISSNFLKLATQAEMEQDMDEHKLDSVVLALGCLLNFAECDPSLRGRLSEMKPDKDNYIEQLVVIFNSQVSKVDEAMTKEQSQISVAFGYLSMLLCTLSLHPNIRHQITQSLKHKSFDELCTAAEKFFGHLRTLEDISADDSSMSSFTARFSTILGTVRNSTA